MADFDGDPPPFEDLRIEPMMFLSGKFQGSEKNWNISHKELIPVVKAFTRLHFMLAGHQKIIHLFTDHKNLIYLIKPEWSANIWLF
jgi:hypothetical protein